MIESVELLVRRNLDKYRFGIAMDLSERVKLMRDVYNATKDMDGHFHRLKDMK
jgi:hypothetical protein